VSLPHIVIVGGGFAGLDAARALSRADVRVTLIDRRNHHVFQPLLYQVATAGLSPGDIASPIRWILRRQRNLRVLLGDVQGIEPDDRRLVLDGGEVVGYDALNRRGRAHALLLRPRRLGGTRSRAQDPRRCARDSPAGAVGVRGGRT
jgi:NADH:ubiquinone reductase (H+-translocating)